MQQLEAAKQGPKVPIRYIGKKPFKVDNIGHTNIVWTAPGDIQPYPVEKAPALLAYKDVWKLAAPGEQPDSPIPDNTPGGSEYDSWGKAITVVGGGEAVSLRNMTREAETNTARDELHDTQRGPAEGSKRGSLE